MQTGGGISALITNSRQAMTRIGALDVDRHALYRLDLEGVWKQSSLDRAVRSASIVFF
jgi:hypothetical protein